jgi:hypothetical protein
MALTGCAAERIASTTGSVVVADISARAAREHARTRGLINKQPLPAHLRRLLQEQQLLPANVPLLMLPKGFVDALPVVAGHEWLAAGTDLLLVNTETRIITNILRGPLR